MAKISGTPKFRNFMVIGFVLNGASHLCFFLQNMNVCAVPKPQYGNFYKGDSYIILSVSFVLTFSMLRRTG